MYTTHERIASSFFTGNAHALNSFLADRTGGYTMVTLNAIAPVCRLWQSIVCNVCIVAKRCVLPKVCVTKQIGDGLWELNGHVIDDDTRPW